jgi:hypothetical protein
VAAMSSLFLHQFATPYTSRADNWAKFFFLLSMVGNCGTQIASRAVEAGNIVDARPLWLVMPLLTLCAWFGKDLIWTLIKEKMGRFKNMGHQPRPKISDMEKSEGV